jgi:hypothetical protein
MNNVVIDKLRGRISIRHFIVSQWIARRSRASTPFILSDHGLFLARARIIFKGGGLGYA